MLKVSTRDKARRHRQIRVRKKTFGTSERPRLNIYRSLKHIHAQIIDDERGVTLAAASTLDPAIRDSVKGANMECAKKVGELIAKKALEEGVKKVTFDRAGYKYHGRVKALADAAREAGLDF
mgnify:CR=1 FL=1